MLFGPYQCVYGALFGISLILNNNFDRCDMCPLFLRLQLMIFLLFQLRITDENINFLCIR